jgi:pterin-4a-carbinolamine dehydratase
MKKLLTEVMHDYFAGEQEQEFEPLRGLVIQRDVPVVPKKATRWQKILSPNRLHATYAFSSKKEYYLFLVAAFSHERQVNHHAKIICDYPEITIEVYTHDVNDITELDLEYAREIEEIYKDVKDYANYNEKDTDI